MDDIISIQHESPREVERRLRLERLYGNGGAIKTKPCKPEIVKEFRERMSIFIQSYENGTNVDVRKALSGN